MSALEQLPPAPSGHSVSQHAWPIVGLVFALSNAAWIGFLGYWVGRLMSSERNLSRGGSRFSRQCFFRSVSPAQWS